MPPVAQPSSEWHFRARKFHVKVGSLPTIGWEPTGFQVCPVVKSSFPVPDFKTGLSIRLQWDHQENTSDIFLLLEAIRKGCSRLERLVIYQEELRYSGQKEGTIPLDAADQIVTFAASMQHLSALCLSCLLLDSSVMEETNRRLAEEIIPIRPSFWFHVGFELPKENDPSVPRVHYDEIVHPINSFDSPPKFF